METVYVTIEERHYHPITLIANIRDNTTGKIITTLASSASLGDLGDRIDAYCEENQFAPVIINIVGQTIPTLDDSIPPAVRKEISESAERYLSEVNIRFISKSFSDIDDGLEKLEVMCRLKPSVLESVRLVDIYASLCSIRHSLQMIYRKEYREDNDMTRNASELKNDLHNIKLYVLSCYDLARERNMTLLSRYTPYPNEYPIPSDILLADEVDLIYGIIDTMDKLSTNYANRISHL